jgi:WD40 repeat protein
MRNSLLVAVCLTAALGACRQPEPQVGGARVVPQVAPVLPRRVSFSPVDNNRLLVMEMTGLVGIWDVPAGGTPQLFASIPAGAIDATFSPDGKSVITVGTDGHVRWWGTDGTLKWVSQAKHEGPARTVAVSADTIVSGGEDGAIRIWRHDGSSIGELAEAHNGPLMSIAISPRGDLLSLGGDETVRLWKPAAGAGPHGDNAKYEAHDLLRPEKLTYPSGFMRLLRMDTSWGWDHAVAVSPQGDVIVAGLFDHSLHFWSGDGAERAVLPNPHRQRHVRSIWFSPKGDLVATAGWDGTVRLWKLDGSPYRQPVEAHLNIVFSVSFSADGTRLATTGFDNLVRIWKTNGTREIELPHGHEDRVTTVAVDANAPVLATAYQAGVLRLWDFDGSPHGAALTGHQGFVQALAFSPQGILASAASDGSLRLWSPDGALRGETLRFGKGERPRSKIDLMFSPNGDVLAVGAAPFQLFDQKQRLWEGRLRTTDWVRAIAFSPRGDFIVTGSAFGDIQVWNLDGSTRAGPLKQKTEYITAVAMAPDGNYFAAVVGSSPTITLFNLDITPRGTPLEGHFGTVHALAFSPDGRLASGGDDGTVRLWTLPSGKVETIDVGLPISQLGYRGDVLWVRAAESVFFYAPNRTLLGTILLRDDAALAYTPDGWYSGANEKFVRVFDDAGNALPAAEAAKRNDPGRVVKAITNGRPAAAPSR